MTVTVDQERRVRLPSLAQPGDVFEIEESGRDQFLLTRVEQTPGRVRLERKNGYLVAVTDHAISHADTRRKLDEFP